MTASTIQRSLIRAGGRDVPLLAGPGALGSLQHALEEVGFKGRLWLVADARAAELHADSLASFLPDLPRLLISGAETDKTVSAVSKVWDWLVEHGVQRRDALVAFGGGVVCDLVGFAAATYLRGIGAVNVPTTLLAQVDASVGGKTGVNHGRGKNLIGAFHQPLAVVADTNLLRTLSPREFANGMAEVAKTGMALDASLFEDLERQSAPLGPESSELLTPIVARSVELKAGVVERDERESGERMLLNYGHTIGHALEAATGYGSLLHGEAVAIGMEAAAFIAVERGLLDQAAAARQTRLLESLRLPLRAPTIEAEAVLPRLVLDKKREGTRQRWVLAHEIGHAEVHEDIPEELVVAAVRHAVAAA